MADAFEIQRPIEGSSAIVNIRCEPGIITQFCDNEGSHLLAYTRAFAGEHNAPTLHCLYQGRGIKVSELARVGFGVSLPEDLSTREFLKTLGLSAHEVEKVLDDYDLTRVASFACPALSNTAIRQLQLLQALHTKQPIIVLNDPFQPFSGRWREHFAERILKEIKTSHRVVTVLNLGFTPKCWLEESSMRSIDLNAETTRALEKALRMDQERHKAELQEKKKTTLSLAEAAAQANALVPEQSTEAAQSEKPASDITKKLPAPLAYAYQGVYDWIFAPMADFCNRVRSYSGALALGGLTLLVVAMGFCLNPDFREYHAKMRTLWTNLQNSPQPSAQSEEAMQQQPNENAAVPQSVADTTSLASEEEETASTHTVEIVSTEAQLYTAGREPNSTAPEIEYTKLLASILPAGTEEFMCSLSDEDPAPLTRLDGE